MNATIILGDEYDEAIRGALRAVLKEVEAELREPEWGMAGSQEITRQVALIAGERLIIEAETYIGLSISGRQQTIDMIAGKVRNRLGA